MKNFNYNSNYLTLTANKNDNRLDMAMQLHTPIVNTKYLPHTYELLYRYFPQVLNTICYNEENLPFAREVERTEIGHLFEHILLSYLCSATYEEHMAHTEFNGITSWNWEKNKHGSFDIEVSGNVGYEHLYQDALVKSINLTEEILKYKSVN